MLVHTDVMLTQIGSRNKRLCDAGRLRSARCRALHGRLCVFLGAAYTMHFLSSVLLLVLNSSLSWDRQGDRLWGCFLSVRKWLFSNTDLEDHAPRGACCCRCSIRFLLSLIDHTGSGFFISVCLASRKPLQTLSRCTFMPNSTRLRIPVRNVHQTRFHTSLTSCTNSNPFEHIFKDK